MVLFEPRVNQIQNISFLHNSSFLFNKISDLIRVIRNFMQFRIGGSMVPSYGYDFQTYCKSAFNQSNIKTLFTLLINFLKDSLQQTGWECIHLLYFFHVEAGWIVQRTSSMKEKILVFKSRKLGFIFWFSLGVVCFTLYAWSYKPFLRP